MTEVAMEERLNRDLVDLLHSRGQLADARWRDALLAVPRHLFAPATGWITPDRNGNDGRRIDRAADTEGWCAAVYSDGSIVTQRQDGAARADAESGTPISSLSAPGVVVEFLDLLGIRANDRVLEIGTGTGWTSALLAHIIGEGNVTTVEIDEQIAGQAALNLKAAGIKPRLITANGASGYPEGGPYDRVHATCSVTEVPYAWVEQTRPGGTIVVPWQPRIHQGWKLRLTVEGPAAYGRFHGSCGYMLLRNQRREVRWEPHHADKADVTTTRLDPRTIDQAGPGFALTATALVAKVAMFRKGEADGSFSLLLCEVGQPADSWAACDYEPARNEFEVTQYGDRQLWDELEDAFGWWIRHGSPDEKRFGLVVSPKQERLWLDEPARLV